MDEDLDTQDRMPPEKGGRRQERVNFYSQKSVRQLARLGFDPITQMVDLYKKLAKELAKMEEYRDYNQWIKDEEVKGAKPRPYSQMAYSQLVATQQKIINDLMRYGYARVSETVIMQPAAKQPLLINMTDEGQAYIEPVISDVQEIESIEHLEMSLMDVPVTKFKVPGT